MACNAPDEIQEGDLLAFIEGSASQRVRDHIAQCAHCAREAAALARLDQLVDASRYRASCPPTDDLLQYQAGLLPTTHERRRIRRHTRDCPLCAAELDQLSALDDPEHSLWEEMRRAVRTVVKALHVPPSPVMAAAVRGGQFNQRLYRAGDIDILVGSEALQDAQEGWQLRGRVTHEGIAGAELTGTPMRIVQQDRIIALDRVDDLGYFCFRQLDPGPYDLWMERPEHDIVIHSVIIGASQDPSPV